MRRTAINVLDSDALFHMLIEHALPSYTFNFFSNVGDLLRNQGDNSGIVLINIDEVVYDDLEKVMEMKEVKNLISYSSDQENSDFYSLRFNRFQIKKGASLVKDIQDKLEEIVTLSKKKHQQSS